MFQILNYHTATQPIADMLQAIVRRPSDPALDELYRRALIGIGHFQAVHWYPQAFADALEAAPGEFSFDNIGRLTYAPSGDYAGETYEAVSAVIERYLRLVGPSEQPQYLTIPEAADYLGIAVPTVKKYLYVTGELTEHHRAGKTVMLDRAELDALKAEGIRPRGRPAGS